MILKNLWHRKTRTLLPGSFELYRCCGHCNNLHLSHLQRIGDIQDRQQETLRARKGWFEAKGLLQHVWLWIQTGLRYRSRQFYQGR